MGFVAGAPVSLSRIVTSAVFGLPEADARARRVGEHEVDDLVVLVEVVVDEQDAEGLRGLAGGEAELAERDLVVALLRGMAGLRLVEGVEVDGGRARDVARARDGDVDVAGALADGEVVGRRTG